ncbi:cytochrome P450 [Nocardia brasiliensis]
MTKEDTSIPGMRRVPIVKGVPIFDHYYRFRTAPLEFMQSLPSCGDLVRIWIGPRLAYVPCTPKLVNQVLMDSTTFDKGGPIYDRAMRLMGKGLGTSQHELHRGQRLHLQPAFHKNNLPAYSELVMDAIAAEIRDWQGGELIDAYEEAYRIAVTTTGHFLFSTNVTNEIADDLRISLRTFMSGVFKRATAPLGLLSRLPTRDNRVFEGAGEHVQHVIRRIIAEYRQQDFQNDDVMSLLLQLRAENGELLSEQELLDHVVTLFVGGIENTSATLSNALLMIAQHPDVQRRLQDEIDSTLERGSPKWDDIARLPVTNQIVTETLRLYPTVWITTRITTRTADLDGHTIPKGAIVIVSPYLIHRRADLFEEPDSFDLLRWNRDAGTVLPRGSLIPFLAGARKCIADSFAIAEITLAIATIVADWHLSPASHGGLEPLTTGMIRLQPPSIRLSRRPLRPVLMEPNTSSPS